MLSFLSKRFGRGAPFPAPEPENPLCVIGDVHGCLDLLEKLLNRVPQDHKIILVGDYIDRGEQSADVLRLIQSRPDLTCLMGNHEEMFLRFIRDPETHGARWLRYGGLQTVASFGVHGARLEMSKEEMRDCRDNLFVAMGDDLCQWVAGLKTSEFSGNVLVAHAGADPGIAPDRQPEETLIWGHPGFHKIDRKDGVWVVHGHTIVAEAIAKRGRISIDTGAYATGALTAVCLDGTEPKFITVRR